MAALGIRSPGLRITSRKQEVHGVSTSTDRVHRRVDGSIVDQPLGCLIGCSASKLNRLDGLVQMDGETAGQVAVGVGLGEEGLVSNAATASAPAAKRSGGSS
jgi:hypothetical protein